MSVKTMLQLEADSVAEKTIKIPFEFSNVPEGKNPGEYIVINPITVRTWFRLKPLLAMIEKEDTDKLKAFKNVEFNLEIESLMVKYDGLLFEIVCIGIHNKPDDMPKWFKDVLQDSCSWEDIYILLNAILFRLGSVSFMNSITALKAVSPLDEREMIALQENKKKWTRKAASLFSSPSTKHSAIPISRP